MKTQVSKSDFCQRFVQMGREENFSWEARELLFDWLEEMDPNSEIDVIAVCCEYAESSAREIADDYMGGGDFETEDNLNEAVRDYLENNTTLVGETAEGFVFAVF